MVVPYAASAIMKLRLTPSAYQQSMGLSKVFFGETALAAGFIDEIDLPERVLSRAQEAALEFTKLDLDAHAASKLRARADALEELRAGIDGVSAEVGVQ
jgi:enoyl-CoA hydratase